MSSYRDFPLDVSDSPIEYQKSVLTDVIDEAIREGVISTDEGTTLQQRVSSIDSLTEADQYWNTLFDEYDLPDD